MSVLKFSLPLLTLILPLMMTAPADAATVRRHVDCLVVSAGVGGLTSTQIASFANITNNLSFTIPAGTVFTINVQGVQHTYQSGQALGPGAHVATQVQYNVPTSPCDATFPDAKFAHLDTKLLTNGAKLQTSP